MRIYNTLTKHKEEFIPIEEGKARIYVCGPTVYDYFHIGNARPFVFYGTLRSYLESKGYEVTYVMNFTDVDDKIIDRANEQGITPKELSEYYIQAYFEDARALGIRDADIHPKVSEHIAQIIDMVALLVEKGHAYQTEDGVYFRVSSFGSYGQLTGQPLDSLMAGARVEQNEDKESPLDFALWKAMKPGEISWPSPWGDGRPGWHIECSAMGLACLGDAIDIHGGGIDLIFPHHTNEIAQSEASLGGKYVRYWMHNGFINMGEEKMSKSEGNFFTVRDILKSHAGEAVRLYLLSVHYRSPLAFSSELLDSAATSLERLYNAKIHLERLLLYYNGNEDAAHAPSEGLAELHSHCESFEQSLEDDMNTANAITALFEMARSINVHFTESSAKADVAQALEIYTSKASILGLLNRKEEMLPESIERLIEEREQARLAKDYKRSDEIRDLLKSEGIILEDTKQGIKWRRA